MIRALGLGIIGVSLLALANAQNADEGVRDLERELFGVEGEAGAHVVPRADEHVRVDIFYRNASSKYKNSINLVDTS